MEVSDLKRVRELEAPRWGTVGSSLCAGSAARCGEEIGGSGRQPDGGVQGQTGVAPAFTHFAPVSRAPSGTARAQICHREVGAPGGSQRAALWRCLEGHRQPPARARHGCRAGRPQGCGPRSRTKLARPEGFEPPTYSFGSCHSIRLSYGRGPWSLAATRSPGVVAVPRVAARVGAPGGLVAGCRKHSLPGEPRMVRHADRSPQ